MFSIFTGALTLLQWAGDKVAAWSERQDALTKAAHEARVAELHAKREIAAYKVKADLEWDLKWAEQASTSWKDEWLLIMWSIPMVGMFFPWSREYVIEGFQALTVFNKDILYWYMGGWSIIFAAVYGLKQAASIMLPGQTGRLATALASLPSDVPEAIAAKAQETVSAALARGAKALN